MTIRTHYCFCLPYITCLYTCLIGQQKSHDPTKYRRERRPGIKVFPFRSLFPPSLFLSLLPLFHYLSLSLSLSSLSLSLLPLSFSLSPFSRPRTGRRMC